jgi:Tfp pilus assembly protein PilF
MGRKDEAEKFYELCMEINPKDPTVLNNYMILLYEIGKDLEG